MVDGAGEAMPVQTSNGDVVDRPARALQDEPIRDLGWPEALRATDELKPETVHCVAPNQQR